MGLINLKTDLKSLRYGNDRIGGGNSGQPYIKTNIPDNISPYIGTTDFLLRGGINAVKDSVTDIVRLTKMFFDTKSPNGLLFIAKQRLLSQTSVRTQTSGILNEGNYSLLSTLAEAGVIAFGYHLNKQGDPFAETGAYANNNNLYFNKVNPNPNDLLGSTLNNRLVKIYEEKQAIKNLNPNVLSYTGGPGSILGVGNTNIRFTSPSNRTGINNNNGVKIEAGTYQTQRPISRHSLTKPPLGVSNEWFNTTKLNDSISFPELTTNAGYTYELNANISVYSPKLAGTFPDTNNEKINAQNTYTYNQKDIIQTENNVVINSIASPKIQDFRQKLRDSKNPQNGLTIEQAKQSGQLAESQTYNINGAANFTQRVNIGDPGKRGAKNYANYAEGVRIGEKSAYLPFSTTPGGLDRINSLPIYRSKAVDTTQPINDFVKFRIAVIDNDSPNYKTFMHFRAFLGPISDTYSATWNGFNYLGRGEKFYNYGGFDRQISLSWTVAAQSKQELIPMYKKLNYLASTLAPDYSPDGYMRGNLVQLTIGGYLYEQPGFITGLTYEMGEDSPWEIGIGSSDDSEDGTVKELCQIIRVTGFNFTPIHNFVPRKQRLTFIEGNIDDNADDDTGFVNTYGPQQFIALSNGPGNENNNYNNDNTSVAVANKKAQDEIQAAQAAVQAATQTTLAGIPKRGLR